MILKMAIYLWPGDYLNAIMGDLVVGEACVVYIVNACSEYSYYML